MMEIIRQISESLTPERYIISTRILSSLWTLADVIIVFYLIQIANLLRRYTGLAVHKIPYFILALTVPFAAMLPFAPTGFAFVKLEFAITFPHFLLIIYLLVGNANVGAAALNKYARRLTP